MTIELYIRRKGDIIDLIEFQMGSEESDMDEVKITLKPEELKKVLRMMISSSEIDSLAALGRELGYKETTFRTAVAKNSMRYKDFVKAADALGYEIIVRSKN